MNRGFWIILFISELGPGFPSVRQCEILGLLQTHFIILHNYNNMHVWYLHFMTSDYCFNVTHWVSTKWELSKLRCLPLSWLSLNCVSLCETYHHDNDLTLTCYCVSHIIKMIGSWDLTAVDILLFMNYVSHIIIIRTWQQFTHHFLSVCHISSWSVLDSS